jgi:hypothetical protein
MSPRRFPPPWTPRRAAGGFEVRDARGQQLVLVQAHENEFAARNMGLLTLDEARRVAIGIARLPDLMRREANAEPMRERFPAFLEVERRRKIEEVARFDSGHLGLKLFPAFVAEFPHSLLMLTTGTHRLRLHKPAGYEDRE